MGQAGKKSDFTPNDFKDIRQELRLSRQKLADEMGLSRRTIEYWEWGHRPIPLWAETLLLCIKLAYLVRERGLQPPK